MGQMALFLVRRRDAGRVRDQIERVERAPGPRVELLPQRRLRQRADTVELDRRDAGARTLLDPECHHHGVPAPARVQAVMRARVQVAVLAVDALDRQGVGLEEVAPHDRLLAPRQQRGGPGLQHRADLLDRDMMAAHETHR